LIEADATQLKQIIKRVLVECFADLNNIPNSNLTSLAFELFALGVISDTIKDSPTIDSIMKEFNATINFKNDVSTIQNHCIKLLKAFSSVGGSCKAAADALRDKLKVAVNTELNINFELVF
jgi:hypothetical protein